MRAIDVMSSDFRACQQQDSLSTAACIMWEQDCGSVPVLDGDGSLVGMITDRDICMAGLFQSRRLAELTVAAAMSSDVASCRDSDSVQRLHELMRAKQVRRLPVVDQGRKLVGIVSISDLARSASKDVQPLGRRREPDELALTLEAIGRPRKPRAEPRIPERTFAIEPAAAAPRRAADRPREQATGRA